MSIDKFEIGTIQKSKKSDRIIVRCNAPKEEDELLNTIYGLVANSNTNLANKLLATTAITSSLNTTKTNADLLFIKDFMRLKDIY